MKSPEATALLELTLPEERAWLMKLTAGVTTGWR